MLHEKVLGIPQNHFNFQGENMYTATEYKDLPMKPRIKDINKKIELWIDER